MLGTSSVLAVIITGGVVAVVITVILCWSLQCPLTHRCQNPCLADCTFHPPGVHTRKIGCEERVDMFGVQVSAVFPNLDTH